MSFVDPEDQPFDSTEGEGKIGGWLMSQCDKREAVNAESQTLPVRAC